jgi:hypothetical protein
MVKENLGYTKGDWTIAGEDKTFVYCLNANDTNRFSLLVQGGYTETKRTPREELEANARLIASAPLLLSTLKEALNMLNVYVFQLHPDDIVAQAQKQIIEKAIKRAEGK